MTEFEYIVVGNGMFGSAAARYLSRESNSVAVIGPGEPENPLTHDGVYSSHYDARRVARLIGRSAIRSELGRQSIAKFRMLEERSGISFYEPVGCLIANSTAVQDNNLESPRELAPRLGIAHTLYEKGNSSWRENFPHFDFPESYWILHEPAPAGMIDPRAMLQAQNTIAVQQGAIVIPQLVVDIHDVGDRVHLETHSGERYSARKVLVTVGSFTNCFNLFPNILPLVSETEIYVLAEVSAEEADRLKGMPTLSYFIDDPAIRDVYMTPAVRYADGNYYLKMGANTPTDYNPASLSEIQEWFQRGDSDLYLSDLERVMHLILPGVRFISFQTKRCILTRTAKKYPIIDQVTERTYVASGAHGAGARSADAFGELAAGLTIDGRWPNEIPRQLFRV